MNHISWQPIETVPQPETTGFVVGPLVYAWVEYSPEDIGSIARSCCEWAEHRDGRLGRMEKIHIYGGVWCDEFHMPIGGKPVAWFKVNAPSFEPEAA